MLPGFQTGTPTSRPPKLGQRATLFTLPYSFRQFEGTIMVNSHPDSDSTSAKNCWLTGFTQGWLTTSSLICLLYPTLCLAYHTVFGGSSAGEIFASNLTTPVFHRAHNPRDSTLLTGKTPN